MAMSSIFTVPSYLWHSYLDYLWNYDSNSWVATLAYAFRIWAILAILPTLLLALLDVTSYVIARTLGDPTASTSHKSSFATQLPPKPDSKNANNADSTTGPQTAPDPDPILAAVLPPESPTSGIISTKSTTPASTPAVPGTSTTAATPSRAFFVDGEGSEDDIGAARLAGVGVFSPVASMPGSPTVSRRNFFEKDGEDDAGGGSASGTDESGSPSVAPRGVLLRSSSGGTTHHHQHHQGGREAETEQEQEHEHSRSASDGGVGVGVGGGVNGGGSGSTSGESSFAILDREESFEDAGVHIRRRVPGAPGASSADE